MTTWILYLMLANGEAADFEVDRHLCEYAPIALEAGHLPPADYYGQRIEITRAACHGPKNVDPCELGPTS